MRLKYLLIIAQKMWLALAVLVGIGCVLSFVEGMMGYGESYFGTAAMALFVAGVLYGLSYVSGAAYRSLFGPGGRLRYRR